MLDEEFLECIVKTDENDMHLVVVIPVKEQMIMKKKILRNLRKL